MCDLDAVNMCCWTHSVDITEAEYCEGVCHIGYYEEDEFDMDDEDFIYEGD
jgi:hypothetical protein